MRQVFLLLFLLASCTTINLTGQVVEEKDLASLKSQAFNKQKVLEVLGSPTLVSQEDNNTWYYVSRSMKSAPLSKPQLVSQQIVKVSFDAQGNLLDAAIEKSQSDVKLAIDRDCSPSYAKGQSAIGHFIKNFGRFNKTREKKR